MRIKILDNSAIIKILNNNFKLKLNFLGMKKDNYYDDEFKGFVQALIDSGRIEGKEAGIAKCMLDKGYDALSDKQKYVFDKMIENNTIAECKRCGCDIPWSEMLEALDNGGYCNYCQYMMEKIDKE